MTLILENKTTTKNCQAHVLLLALFKKKWDSVTDFERNTGKMFHRSLNLCIKALLTFIFLITQIYQQSMLRFVLHKNSNSWISDIKKKSMKRLFFSEGLWLEKWGFSLLCYMLVGGSASIYFKETETFEGTTAKTCFCLE